MLHYNNMYKEIQGVLFLLQCLYIFGGEFILYKLDFNNYVEFITRLAHRLASVNILCVKIFQAIALNNSLIDEKINNELIKFTDNAPWSYDDIESENLLRIADKYDLNINKKCIFPINTGMISLVFKLRKKDMVGTPVIIKMKRKNIQQLLDNAINNFALKSLLL